MFKLNKMHVLGGVAFSMMAVSTGWAQSTEPVQNFPSKPITVVVTFPVGGGTDILARLLGNHFTETFGQSAIVKTAPAPAATWAPSMWPIKLRMVTPC